MPEFEELKYIGSFGLDRSISFEIIRQPLGGGYAQRLLTGSTAGMPAWRLIYKVLPDTKDGPIQLGSESQSRARYLWNFYIRHQAQSSGSFILTDPFDGNRYLVGFLEDSLSYNMFATKLYSSGLSLEYRREPGVATLPDGSLGLFENPDEI